jgi:hypothetical protein
MHNNSQQPPSHPTTFIKQSTMNTGKTPSFSASSKLQEAIFRSVTQKQIITQSTFSEPIYSPSTLEFHTTVKQIKESTMPQDHDLLVGMACEEFHNTRSGRRNLSNMPEAAAPNFRGTKTTAPRQSTGSCSRKEIPESDHNHDETKATTNVPKPPHSVLEWTPNPPFTNSGIALDSHGPSTTIIQTIKKDSEYKNSFCPRNWTSRNINCYIHGCGFCARIFSPDLAYSSTPAKLYTCGTHNHAPITWKGYFEYKTMYEESKNTPSPLVWNERTYKKRAGLPGVVLADKEETLKSDPKIDNKDGARRIEKKNNENPIYQSAMTRKIIKRQVMDKFNF